MPPGLAFLDFLPLHYLFICTISTVCHTVAVSNSCSLDILSLPNILERNTQMSRTSGNSGERTAAISASSMSADVILRVPNISYPDFRKNHLLPNQPVLIGQELIENWPCLQHWKVVGPNVLASPFRTDETQRPSAHSPPNLEYMREKYGRFTVPVDEDGCRSEKPLHEILDMWEGKTESEGDGDREKIYVKDWHLALQLESRETGTDSAEAFDGVRTFYTTPDIFSDDWMNLYYLKSTMDDFRFVVGYCLEGRPVY